jgi:hypothetical protein
MNNKGFALAWLSILLVMILGVLSSTSSLLIVQWNKNKNVEYCRKELKSIQQFAAEQAKLLLSLNPQSVQLRAELFIVEGKIVAALAAGQVPLVKLLKIQRTAIRLRQKKLDMTQKLIVKNTHTSLKLKIHSLQKSMNDQILENKKKLSSWGNSQHLLGPPPISRFSFKPTDRLLAPTYEPYINFEKNQSMAISWIEKYEWSSFQKAFSFPTRIRSQCRLSLKEGSWNPIIQKDRL